MMMYNTNGGSDNTAFKLLYYWVMVGKWRRWCIPGAFFTVFTVWLIPGILRLAFNDSRKVNLIIWWFYHITALPLKFLLEIGIIPKNKTIFFFLFLAWYGLLGAGIGALARIVWVKIKGKPQRESCYILENEKIEQIDFEHTQGNTNGK